MDQGSFYLTIGKNIKLAREKRGLTQQDLADAVQLSRTSITNIEMGRQHFSAYKLWEIASSMGVSIVTLLSEQYLAEADLLPKSIGIKSPPDFKAESMKTLFRQVLKESPPSGKNTEN